MLISGAFVFYIGNLGYLFIAHTNHVISGRESTHEKHILAIKQGLVRRCTFLLIYYTVIATRSLVCIFYLMSVRIK